MRLPLHNQQHHHIFTRPPHSPYIPKPMATATAISLSSSSHRLFTNISPPLLTTPTNPLPLPAARSRLLCRTNDSDMMSQLELGKSEEKRKPQKHVNGIFWILLLNLGVYVADHFFQVKGMLKMSAITFTPLCNNFKLLDELVFQKIDMKQSLAAFIGKLVEEEEGNFALWLSYILTGAGANLVSWLVLPTNAVSVGASGAVFGLFAVSVLVKMSWDWRKILEVLILGQFVVEKVMEAAQASTELSGSFRGGYALQNVNHVAHLSGALIGVLLVWLVSRIPHQPSDQEIPSRRKKTG